MVSFTSRPLYRQGKSPLYRLDGPQSWSGRCGRERNLLPLRESNFRRPARIQSLYRLNNLGSCSSFIVPSEVILSVITSNLLTLVMPVIFNASRPLQGYILFRIFRNVCDPCPHYISLTQPQKISCLEVLRATLVCCSQFVLHVHPVVACLTYYFRQQHGDPRFSRLCGLLSVTQYS